MQKSIKKNINGITLVALVVTIVVLLILAGVSLNLVLGNNGIVSKAKDAKNKTEQAKANEEKEFGKLEDWLDKQLGDDSNEEMPTVKINLSISGEKVTTPPIPEGFHELEGTINTGYVIEGDGDDGNQFVWVPVDKNQKISLNVTSSKNDITELKLIDPYGDTILTIADANITTEYNNTNITPTINGVYLVKVTTSEGTKTKMLGVHSLYATDAMNDYYITDEFENLLLEQTGLENMQQFWEMLAEEGQFESVDAMLAAMGYSNTEEALMYLPASEIKKYQDDVTDTTVATSVNTNGGFYVGRYEAGTSITPRTSGNSNDTVETIIATNGKSVVKADYEPYNNITYDQAKGLAESMYTGKSYTCSLLTGSAWDRTLGWIHETGKPMGQIAGESSSWGNYNNVEFSITRGKYSENYGQSYEDVVETYAKDAEKSVLLTTGATTRNSANNIFDIAGNVYEWTLEAYATDDRVNRGGSYGATGSYSPASGRFNSNPDSYGDSLGFRPALYL